MIFEGPNGPKTLPRAAARIEILSPGTWPPKTRGVAPADDHTLDHRPPMPTDRRHVLGRQDLRSRTACGGAACLGSCLNIIPVTHRFSNARTVRITFQRIAISSVGYPRSGGTRIAESPISDTTEGSRAWL